MTIDEMLNRLRAIAPYAEHKNYTQDRHIFIAKMKDVGAGPSVAFCLHPHELENDGICEAYISNVSAVYPEEVSKYDEGRK